MQSDIRCLLFILRISRSHILWGYFVMWCLCIFEVSVLCFVSNHTFWSHCQLFFEEMDIPHVQGTMHQANVRQNGNRLAGWVHSGRSQCTVMAVVALALCLLIARSKWVFSTIDLSLMWGDHVFSFIVDSFHGGDLHKLAMTWYPVMYSCFIQTIEYIYSVHYLVLLLWLAMINLELYHWLVACNYHSVCLLWY